MSGTKLFCISGPRQQALQRRGGARHHVPRAHRQATAAACAVAGTTCSRRSIPGGSSVPLVPAEQIIDTPRWTSTHSRTSKSGLGTAAVIVLDKSTDIVSRDRPHQPTSTSTRSCGQCTPCREGTGWMWRVDAMRMAEGRAQKPRDRHAPRCHEADRGSHHLRAGRCCGLADPGPDQRHFRPEIEQPHRPTTAANPHSDPVPMAAE